MSPSLMSHATSKALVINMATVIGQTCVTTLPPYIAHLPPPRYKSVDPLQRIGVRGGEGSRLLGETRVSRLPKVSPSAQTDEVRGGNVVPVLTSERRMGRPNVGAHAQAWPPRSLSSLSRSSCWKSTPTCAWA